jgi:hypothetical protein
MRWIFGVPLAVATAAALPTAPARAQGVDPQPLLIVGRADLYSTTLDRWRGIRRSVHPVIQLDAMAGLRTSGLSATGGVWTSLEPGDTRDQARPDLRAGPTRFNMSSAWVQLGGRSGPLIVTAGAVRDWFARPDGSRAVSELYGSARLQVGRWAVSGSAWQAVSGADGLYLEPAIAVYHFVNPFTGPALSWTTTLRAGFQVDERDPSGGVVVPGPRETGLTHVALGTSIRAAFNVGGPLVLAVVATPEVQANRDPSTKLRKDGTSTGWLRFWLPFQLGLSLPLRRPG